MLTTKQKIFIAKTANRLVGLGRKAAGLGMKGQFRRGSILWDLDLDEGIDFAIYLQGNFEPRTVKFYRTLLSPGQVVFDIGANIGAHTLNFAQAVGPAGKVHAFEPTLTAIRKLRANLALNPGLQPVVELHHAFCSDHAAASVPKAIYSTWPLGEAADLHPHHLGHLEPVGEPEVIVIDELVAKIGLPRLDLIKIDVDGNEISVLNGCRETLKRFHPKVIAEILPSIFEERGESMEGFWDPFRANGYQMSMLNSKKRIPLETKYFDENFPKYSAINVILF